MDFHVAIKICTNDITVNRLCECSCLSQNIGPWYNTVECTGIKFVPLMMVSCSSITHYYDARAKRGMFILLWLTYYQLGQCSLCTSSRARLKHTVNWMENINSHHSKLIFLYVIFEQIISICLNRGDNRTKFSSDLNCDGETVGEISPSTDASKRLAVYLA